MRGKYFQKSVSFLENEREMINLNECDSLSEEQIVEVILAEN